MIKLDPMRLSPVDRIGCCWNDHDQPSFTQRHKGRKRKRNEAHTVTLPKTYT
jgi:hypothetical protein